MKKLMMMTSLAILIPLIVFAFIGCMKKPDHTPNYGPQVSIEEMEKALAIDAPTDPLSIKKGQYVSLDYSQSIDVQPAETFRQRSDEVILKEETATEISWKFTVRENNRDMQTGLWKPSSTDFGPLTYAKPSSTQTATALSSKAYAPQSGMKTFSLKALKAEEQSTPVRVTYHNLKRVDGFMPVPASVKNKPDCGGVKNCEAGLRYIRIAFDRVIWDSPDHGNKTSYQVTYSPDIPTYIFDWTSADDLGFTNQLEFCAQIWIEIQSGSQKQVVPVRECAEVRDFQFGKDQ